MSTTPPTFYVYKLTTDNGGAPCLTGKKLLSLAICKPRIRTGGAIGDVIFGFGGKRLGERLIYIALVTGKESAGAYYAKAKYHGRHDCIYEWSGTKLVWRKNSRYHEGGSLRDIGTPPLHDKAAVLLSTDFRYFGSSPAIDYKTLYPAIRKVIEGLGVGERKNHPLELWKELQALKDVVWKLPKRILGSPSDGDFRRKCYGSEKQTVCTVAITL